MEKENISLEIHNLTVTYNQRPVLWNVDFELPKGKIIGIVGPNGSGKTTLLKCILGLVKPNKGTILINNRSIETNWEYKEQIGYMPQIARFPENLKVAELFKMIKNIINGFQPRNRFWFGRFAGKLLHQ